MFGVAMTAGHENKRLIRLNSPTGTVPFVSEVFNSDKYRRGPFSGVRE